LNIFLHDIYKIVQAFALLKNKLTYSKMDSVFTLFTGIYKCTLHMSF